MTSNKLWEFGSLACINISTIQANERLVADDIGADTEKVNKSIVRLGVKRLFNNQQLRELRAAEAAAYHALLKNSTSFPISNLRFVPNTQMDVVLSRFAEAEEKHQLAVKRLIENFDRFMNYMVATYPSQLSPEDYARTRNKLQAGYCRVRLSTFSLDLVGGSKQQEADLMGEFMESAVRDLRDTVGEAARKLAAKLADGKSISERSLNTMRRLVEKARTANFMDDPVTERYVQQLSDELKRRTAEELRGSVDESATFRRSLEVIADGFEKEDVGSVVTGFLGRVLELDDEDEGNVVDINSRRVVDVESDVESTDEDYTITGDLETLEFSPGEVTVYDPTQSRNEEGNEEDNEEGMGEVSEVSDVDYDTLRKLGIVK